MISCLMEYKTVVRHGPYISSHSWYIALAYPDLYDPILTTSSSGVDAVFKLSQKTTMTYEHVLGVVGVWLQMKLWAMTCGAFHTY